MSGTRALEQWDLPADNRLVSHQASDAPVAVEFVEAQLEKIASSRAFSTADRLRHFLRFVVEQSIRGQAAALKEWVIGVQVFDRGKSFDPRLDAIVRVEAGRLRAKLADYYRIEGRHDRVWIELPKGAYAPVFRERNFIPSDAEPMRNEHSNGLTATADTLATSGLSSIVVLPFVNLSIDPENEYFSDGLTEEVINALARIPGLRVIARSTAFRYKGQAQDVRRVGAELHVTAALEGSVRRMGTRIRITAQLIETANCFHIWSNTYEREVKDILAIQQEIADNIRGMVRVQFPNSSRPPERNSSSNVEAYDLYLRGIYFEGKRSVEGFAKGLEYLQNSANIDVSCSPTFARLASSYTLQAAYGLADPTVAMTRARQAVTRALEIDDNLAEAHASSGCINALYSWNWAAADRDFRRALELNSGVPEVHHRYAFFYLAPTGRGEEALSHIQQAKNLDPMSLVLHAAECAVLVWGRQLEAAIERGCKTVELEPTYYPGHMYLSWAYRRCGMRTQAIERAEEAVRLSAGTPLSLGGLGLAYAAAGKSDEARKVLEQIQQRPYIASTSIASIYAAIGEIEEALKWLERARQERSPGLVYLRVASWNERVRSDPRFDELVRAVGLC